MSVIVQQPPEEFLANSTTSALDFTDFKILLEAKAALARAEEVVALAPKTAGSMGASRWEWYPSGPSAGTQSAVVFQMRATYDVLLSRWKAILWPEEVEEDKLHLLADALLAHLGMKSNAPFQLYAAKYGDIEPAFVEAFVEAAELELPSVSGNPLMGAMLRDAANLTLIGEQLRKEHLEEEEKWKYMRTQEKANQIHAVLSRLGNTAKGQMLLLNFSHGVFDENDTNITNESVSPSKRSRSQNSRGRTAWKDKSEENMSAQKIMQEKVHKIITACNDLTAAVRDFHISNACLRQPDIPLSGDGSVVLTTESKEWSTIQKKVVDIFSSDFHRENFLKLWTKNCTIWSSHHGLQRKLYDTMLDRIRSGGAHSSLIEVRTVVQRIVDASGDITDNKTLVKAIRACESLAADIFTSIFPTKIREAHAVRSMWSSVAFEVCAELSSLTTMRELDIPHQSCIPDAALYQLSSWTPNCGVPFQAADVPCVFIGALINDRYRIKAHIGRGGFGHGWLAEDLWDDNKKVFVKTFLSLEESGVFGSRNPSVSRQASATPTGSLFSVEDMTVRIQDRIRYAVLEITRTRRLKSSPLTNCPHMVGILDVLINATLVVPSNERTSNQFFAIVTEYCDGGELFNYVVKQGMGVSLPVSIGRFLFDQMLDMLEHLSDSGYCHKDIKLENILVKDGFEGIKLIDYGTVRAMSSIDQEEAMDTHFNHQTPEYRHGFFSKAEKHLKYQRSVKKICSALDVWGSGMVLWHLLTLGHTGECAFNSLKKRGYDPHAWAPDLPDLDPVTLDFFCCIFNKSGATPTAQELREHAWMKEPLPKVPHVQAELCDRFPGIASSGYSSGYDRGVCYLTLPPVQPYQQPQREDLLITPCGEYVSEKMTLTPRSKLENEMYEKMVNMLEEVRATQPQAWTLSLAPTHTSSSSVIKQHQQSSSFDCATVPPLYHVHNAPRRGQYNEVIIECWEYVALSGFPCSSTDSFGAMSFSSISPQCTSLFQASLCSHDNPAPSTQAIPSHEGFIVRLRWEQGHSLEAFLTFLRAAEKVCNRLYDEWKERT